MKLEKKELLDQLMIYNKYEDLYKYSYTMFNKIPTSGNNLITDINNKLSEGLTIIIRAQKERNIKEKIKLLGELDTNLKATNFYIKIAYKFKYINSRNYTAWTKKITNINNMNIGWAKKCQKQ